MIAMRRWWVFGRCVLLSALLALCESCSSRVWLTESKDISVDGATSVQVHTGCGDISVAPSDDGAVHVQIQRTAPSRQEAQSLPVDVSVAGSVIQIGWNGSPGEDGVFFAVQVPASLSVSLSSGDRSIHVSGIQGAVDAATDAGDIVVDHVTGRLTARTSGGAISVSGHTGAVDLQTTAGDVSASGALSGANTIVTGAGSIDVAIPAGSSLSVAATTHAGTASNDFGLPSQADGEGIATSFHGTIGTGAMGSLVMEDGAGPIGLHVE
jgi:hypothetical protein